MWICQLCQREFDDTEIKYEISVALLQDIFKGVATFGRDQNEDICYLCEDCNRESLRLIREQNDEGNFS
jgi:DNA-directed RNA polymerase subunit RPC12/RpoP